MDVEIRCVCPAKANGTPRHITDTVRLHDTLGFRAVLTIRNSMRLVIGEDEDGAEVDVAKMLAVLSEQYLMAGIYEWTLVDAKNKPLPISKQTIRERLLDDLDVGITLADAADELYSEKVVLPLLAQASRSSPPTPTSGSTSAPTGSPKKRPKPSSPSLTITSPTVDIETTTTALAGASSS